MAITRTAMIDDDGSGTTGTILNNAWKQELYGQIDAFVGPSGQWTDLPYSAGAFHGSGSLVWTVPSVESWMYTIIGKTCVVAWAIGAGSLSGSGNEVYFDLPAGFASPVQTFNACRIYTGGVYLTGLCYTKSGSALVAISKMDYGAYTTGSFIAQGELTFRLP